MVALAHEFANRGVGGSQRLFVGQENDAEMFGSGTLTEAGAMHYGDMLLPNEFGYENVVALRNVDARVGVESTARRDTTNSRSLRAPLHGEITATAELLFDL